MTTPTGTSTGTSSAAVGTPDGAFALATASLAMVTVATAISMCRVFNGWSFLGPMLAVALGVHIVCWLLRACRVPQWLAMAIGFAALLELMSLVYYRSSMSGPLPMMQTLDAFRSDLRLVWQQFPAAVAPVPSQGNFAVTASLAVALCAYISDAFAFRADGRAEVIVPSGVILIFTSALSADRNRIMVTALWVAASMLAVVALRGAHGRRQVAWIGRRRPSFAATIPLAFLCAGCVSLGAAAIAPRLPGAGQAPLMDTRNRDGDVTQVLSPLVDIRSRLVNRSNTEMFSVVSDNPHYWRVISLSVFDGTTWRPSDQDLRPTNDGLASPPPDSSFDTTTFLINRLGGELVPAAPTPVSVQQPNLYWADVTQTLISTDKDLEKGDIFTITSAISRPSVTQLQQSTTFASPDPESLALPGDLPESVRALARQITEAAPTPYDQARQLQDWFQANFVYDLTVQRGHSSEAITNFLDLRRGYCEQFAGTYAAMARSIGLPTRVVVGFTPGEADAEGRYHVYGRQAHAWVEVWFDSYGWVTFDPTPGRGSPDDQEHTGLPALQQVGPTDSATGASGSPTPIVTVPRDGAQGNPTASSRVPTTTIVNTPGSATRNSDSSTSRNVWLVLGSILGLIVAWLVAAPRLATALRHQRRRASADRIHAAWTRALDSLRLVGCAPIDGATPLEFAAVAAKTTGVDHDCIVTLARLVTVAAYATVESDDAAAESAEELAASIDDWTMAKVSIPERIRHRALLRS